MADILIIKPLKKRPRGHPHLPSPLLTWRMWAQRPANFDKTHRSFDDTLLTGNNERASTRLQDEDDSIVEHEVTTPSWNDPRFQAALQHIMPIERQALDYYYRQNMRQTDVGNKIKRNQSTVSRCMDKSVARLHFWILMPPQPPDRMFKDWFTACRASNWLYAREYAKDCHQARTAERMTKLLGRPITQCAVYFHLHGMLNSIIRWRARLVQKGQQPNNDFEVMYKWLDYVINRAYGPSK